MSQSVTVPDQELGIERLIQAQPAIAPFEMSEQVLAAFINDLAQDIYTKPEICDRYGLTLVSMREILLRPGVLRRVKEARAVFTSGNSIQERARAYYGVVAMEAAQRIDKMIHDPQTPSGLVLEAATLASRNAGVYSTGGGKPESGAGAGGSQFAVNIILSTGDKITTVVDTRPVIEGDA